MTLIEPLVSQPMRPAQSLERPAFEMPEGACDAHMHVFGALESYPCVPHPQYTLPDGKLGHYLNVMETLGIERFVIVQPSFYDTDNRCLIDALKASGKAARGIVMIEPGAPEGMLRAYHDAGVRGVRLDLFKRRGLPLPDIKKYIRDSAAMVSPLGWHLQFYAPGYIVRDLLDFLPELHVDVVIDHMGYMLEEDGLTEADFDRLLAILKEGSCWLKASAPYRLAKKRGMNAVDEIAKAIVRAAPERTIWGSDWPHIPEGGRDTGALLNQLALWAPDSGDRRRILVDNPVQLFNF